MECHDRRLSTYCLYPSFVRATSCTYSRGNCIRFEDKTLTYAELNTRANQLAHVLRDRGVGPEVLVAIGLHRSLEMVIGLFGILKAGGAYVPLDPSYPTKRLVAILEDTQSPVLLTESRLKATWGTYHPQMICLDTDWPMIAQQPSTAPSVSVVSDNLAYVIYTSGSTGQPKGVMITHQNVVHFLTTMQHQPGITAHDVGLAVTTLAFDIAVLELFLPLLVGARTVLAHRDTVANGEALAQLIASSGATLMQATPATWHLLLQSGWTGQAGMTILCGGERLPRDLATQLGSRCKELWNLYGPTETTVWSTRQLVEPGNDQVTIGRPIANTQIYILDAALNPVPIGITGGLYIGGAGVARGYLNRPELTSERFIRNPFGPGRLYQTGDLARYRSDGTIEFLGRADFQVKLRGFRIELGEIETVLSEHPAVQQAVVVAHTEGTDGWLVAYVVSDTVEPATLRAYLAARLPTYMIPSAFVLLDALPLTPNGKVNRQALPNPEQRVRTGAAPGEQPRTPLEHAIASIWKACFRIEQVGVNEHFLDLGGHSLLLVRMYNQIRMLTSTRLTLTHMVTYPTIRSLASFLDQQNAMIHVSEDTQCAGRSGQEDNLWMNMRHPTGSLIPLSIAQYQHWFLNQLQVPFTLNASEALVLRGALDLDALQYACTQIVARHTILRTRYPIVNGQVAPIIEDASRYEYT
ncbi:MAG: amino acid adenylation domain-containing protein, partial [Chloroflexaceae bacterium]|nr:amino acid adenylation domain-containing protein [Chloroflexaceae bacterium]